MNTLIAIKESNGVQSVDARELHEFLEIGKDFSSWMKSRISKYGFTEDEDYKVTLPNLGERTRGGLNKTDYVISIDMAKELAMVENNEQGKKARRYFIAVEKEFRSRDLKVLSPPSRLELAHMVIELEKEKQELLPDAEFGRSLKDDDSLYSVTQVAKSMGMSAIALNKQLNALGILFKQSGDWMPYAKYQNKGFFKIVAHQVNEKIRHQIKITGEGRAFIFNKLNKEKVA